MSIINLLAHDIWSEADIVAHGRAVIAGQVSEARQNELRTIMLGHIAGMRTASADEMTEIALVQAATEAQAIANNEARADMALLQSVLDYEAALARLAQAQSAEPVTIITGGPDGVEVEIANPALAADALARGAAQALVDGAAQSVLDLFALRHPAPAATEAPGVVP